MLDAVGGLPACVWCLALGGEKMGAMGEARRQKSDGGVGSAGFAVAVAVLRRPPFCSGQQAANTLGARPWAGAQSPYDVAAQSTRCRMQPKRTFLPLFLYDAASSFARQPQRPPVLYRPMSLVALVCALSIDVGRAIPSCQGRC